MVLMVGCRVEGWLEDVTPHHEGLLLSPGSGEQEKPQQQGGHTSNRAHCVPLGIPPSPWPTRMRR